MDASDKLKLIGSLAPVVQGFMQTAERSGAPGPEKRQAVLELTEAVYLGAQRTGALDGVKELRGVDWSLIAPLVAILIDGLVGLFNRLRIWTARSAVKP